MSTELMQALHDLGKEKGIEPEVILEAVEAALISAYKKNFGSVQNVQVNIDEVTGEFHVFTCYDVVEEVLNDKTEISLEDAQKLNPNYQVGEVVMEEVTPRNFGRIAAQTAKQVVVQRIREAERGMIYSEFSERESDIVTGTIQRIENRNYYIDLGKIEAVLGPNEQIPGESYEMFDRIKTYIVEVRKATKGPQIMVSRTHPGLLKRLFELEVPEIQDGTVEIKGIAREAGSRTKLAVYTEFEDVDPIGACVGMARLAMSVKQSVGHTGRINVVIDKNAESFVDGTIAVDFEKTQLKFTSKLKEGDFILDFGCGSGRDTKYFLSKGFVVDATDGSEELCRKASEFTEIEVKKHPAKEKFYGVDIERYISERKL